MIQVFDDDYFMRQAIIQAEMAYELGEVPVGAIVVCQDKIIGRGHNLTEKLTDVTAHAEIIAISAASNFLGSKYLNDCTLYVTLEPCPMCAGAIYWSQLGRLVYGAADEKRGFMRFGKKMLHPKTNLAFGILMEPCGSLMSSFFQEKRQA